MFAWLAVVGAADVVAAMVIPLALFQFVFNDTGVPIATLALGWAAQLGTCLGLGMSLVGAILVLNRLQGRSWAVAAAAPVLTLAYAAVTPHALDAFRFTAVLLRQGG